MDSLCSAPAKLILSGEHAVVYGCPAISLAVPLFSYCRCRYTPSEIMEIRLELKDLDRHVQFSEAEWFAAIKRIQKAYRAFLRKETAITQVLQKPEDLFLIALEYFHTYYPLKTGCWEFELRSEIPIGRGLGSSASIIASFLKALAEQNSSQLDQENLLNLTKAIECHQHGHSSGIDPATVVYKGLLHFKEGEIHPIKECQIHGWIIDSGAPLSSTGECVAQVAEHFPANSPIWKAFTDVSERLKKACEQKNATRLQTAIVENQTLLERIGVVPSRIGQFIQALNEHSGGVSKICGAGSIKDGPAGILLHIGPRNPSDFCHTHGMKCYPLENTLALGNHHGKSKP
ncbi:mevalonate kinase [Thiomicrorhabdus sp.]|uniref:mevalonate kinase n=1 Tax=Thiomicrorhabdus sp. TaxID=2039724 RepID=UPI0029C81078|nr:mevalonate kinase [Thiomicrorhabdus sp.]